MENQSQKTASSRALVILSLISSSLFAISGMDFIGYFIFLFLNPSGAETYSRNLINVFLGFGGTFLSLFVIPAIFIKKWDHTPFSHLGSQFGIKKKLGVYMVVLALFFLPLLYIGSSDIGLIQTYPLSKDSLQSWQFFLFYECCYILLYYVPYEFFFRGILHFKLSKSWKLWQTILYVTILTTLLHATKPISEIIGAAIAGILFGLIAHKTKSWYWVFLLHIIIGISTDIFCGLRFLGVIS